MKTRSSHVFYRRLDRLIPQAVRANGVWIEDSEGHRYLDGSCGALVVNVGHGRIETARSVYDQIINCDYVHGTMFTTQAVESLSQTLAAHSPEGIDRFFFLSTGSESVEAAIKLARQIHIESGRPQRIRLICRWKSYHGLTLGALSATARSYFTTPFAPLLTDVIHIPPPYCLRCSYGLKYPQCGIRCASALEEVIHNTGPEIVSAFLAETVSGASLAVFPPPPGYLPLIREICDRYNVLLILDEVMCGLGRTGEWFASQHYDVVPDIVTLGKGLGGGVASISAIGVQKKHFDAIFNGSGNFVHGGTYSHHAVAAAAAQSTLNIIEQEGLVERVKTQGKNFERLLKDRLQDLPCVAEIRGLGFMWGVEIVQNKETLKPYPRAHKVTETVWHNIFENGVITYPATGLAGIDGDALVLGLPFIAGEKEMMILADTLRQSLERILVEGKGRQ